MPVNNIFVLGTYIELVDSEMIGNQKELLVDTVRGFPGAKVEYMVMDTTSRNHWSGNNAKTNCEPPSVRKVSGGLTYKHTQRNNVMHSARTNIYNMILDSYTIEIEIRKIKWG